MAIGNPAKGAQYFFKGLKLITKPKLRWFVLIPLFINIIVFTTLIHLLVDQLDFWIDYYIAKIPSWLAFLEWLVWTIAVVFIAIIVFYTFTLIANIIGAPFNGLLAEQAEYHLKGEAVAESMSVTDMLKLFPRSIAREAQKLLHYIPRVLIALILSLLFPPFAPLIWFVLGASMMSIQYCDYPMDNHLQSFKTLRSTLKKNTLTSHGFGGIVMLATMIPVVNFFVMPAAVCGATAYWVEELEAICENKLLEKN